jgi:hypothetical protein
MDDCAELVSMIEVTVLDFQVLANMVPSANL